MTTGSRLVRYAILSGSIASVVSTLAAAWCGRHESGHAASATNATSHWIWGDGAARQNRTSWRYTAVGYFIHHAASIFWALFFEWWIGRAGVKNVPIKAAATSALACFVDFRLTPPRLTPGFEKRLSRRSLFLVYAAFAVGLLVAAGVRPQDRD